MSEVTSKDGTVVRHFTAASGRTGKKRLLGACTTQTAKGTTPECGDRLIRQSLPGYWRSIGECSVNWVTWANDHAQPGEDFSHD